MSTMLGLLVLSALLATVSSLVCTPQLCAGIKQVPLNCTGSIIKGGGFCRCTDACAKVEGEECQAHFQHGIIPAGTCDTGLVCQEQIMMAFGRGICVLRTRKRSTQSTCEKKRMLQMLSNFRYNDTWVPRCRPDGSFYPRQCDVSGRCFCVDQEGSRTGEIVHGTDTCT